jgi:hypothetical protein
MKKAACLAIAMLLTLNLAKPVYAWSSHSHHFHHYHHHSHHHGHQEGAAFLGGLLGGILGSALSRPAYVQPQAIEVERPAVYQESIWVPGHYEFRYCGRNAWGERVYKKVWVPGHYE